MNQITTHILGAKVDLLDRIEVYNRLSNTLRSRSGFQYIVTLNPELALMAEDNHQYQKLINSSFLTLADGIGLKIGALILGAPLPSRITGTELFWGLCRIAEQQQKSIYLLGGLDNTAERVKAKVLSHLPNLRIVGAEQGIEPTTKSLIDPALTKRITTSGADIVIVAFGSPKQDFWIQQNQPHLPHVRVAVGVGGVFDYLAGNVPTPPMIIRSFGFEWLFRLCTQRGRFRRVSRALLYFPLRCLIWRLSIISLYRRNVVGCIVNKKKEVLIVSPTWSSEIRWQFPQGGVDKGETSQEAILREMKEELGTNKLVIQHYYPNAHKYTWPYFYRLMRGFRGQKQDLFILSFTGNDSDIDITQENELSHWSWSPIDKLVGSLDSPRQQLGLLVKNLLEQLD